MDNYGFQKTTHTKPRKPREQQLQNAQKRKRDKSRSWERVDKRAQWA